LDFVSAWQQAAPVVCEPGEVQPFWQSLYEGTEPEEVPAVTRGSEQKGSEQKGSEQKGSEQKGSELHGAELHGSELEGPARPLTSAVGHSGAGAGGRGTSLPSTHPLVEVKRRARGRAAPPSSHAQRSLWALDPFSDDDIALRGVFVHECFREVRSIDDLVEPSRRDALMERARGRAAVEKGAPISDALSDEIRGVLSQIASSRGAPGSIGSALEVAGDAASVRVLAELAFAREVDGAIVNGRIDRLVLSLRDGVPVGATIIDFKTGAKDSPREVLEAKIAGYRSQLEAYGDAVAEMFTISREAVRLELLFVDRGEVVVLGSS
jgi:hypothetical protein